MVMEIIETIESKIFEKLISEIYTQREKIITAFIAETGCSPDEIEQVVQYDGNQIRWFVRKRGELSNGT